MAVRLKWAKSMKAITTVLMLNAVTVLLLVAAFAPHLIPFYQKKPPAQFVLPVVEATPTPTQVVDATPLISGKPVRIKIDAVKIDLPVADGTYNPTTKKWSLSTTHAHYAVMTPVANNKEGNTFIYGHNRRSVFAALTKLTPGDTAIIETDNGQTFHYILRHIQDVDPADVSLFQYQGKPILTLQTCSGSWYENRRLFTFDFIKVEPVL